MICFVVVGLELGLQFGVEPRDCVVSRHKPALLPCSSPSPNVSYQWTLDNRPLPLVNNSRLQLLSNGSLYIKKVTYNHPIKINHPTLRALTTLQVLFLTDFHSFS